jgi:hypothetical protein
MSVTFEASVSNVGEIRDMFVGVWSEKCSELLSGSFFAELVNRGFIVRSYIEVVWVSSCIFLGVIV